MDFLADRIDFFLLTRHLTKTASRFKSLKLEITLRAKLHFASRLRTQMRSGQLR